MNDYLFPLTTLSFAYPAVLLVPALFLAVRLLRRPVTPGVAFSSITLLESIRPTWRLRLRRPVLGTLSVACIIFLALAAARPQRVSLWREPAASRNLLLALDVSRSMSAPDFESGLGRIMRLDGVKQVVSEFVAARRGDRIGLVVFGSAAYLQAPLTLDHNVILSLVERLQFGMAGDGTAIGDGLGLALKRIEELAADSKAVILLTDGVSNSGQVNPLKAAKVARDLGVKVHTIGIGASADRTARSPGAIFSFGGVQQAEFDEPTLREIARLTGGTYHNATSTAGLKEVYQAIDALEQSEAADPERQIVAELFPQYAWTALALLVTYLFLAQTLFRKLP